MPRKMHYILTLMALLFLGVSISTDGFGNKSDNQDSCGTIGSAASICQLGNEKIVLVD